jgi:putative addiction module component (TIGR02574 family)
MRPSEIAKEIDKLDLSEKLMLVGNIWDDIAKQNAMLPLPEWQKAELDRRYTAYARSEIKTHECFSVHEELRNKYKTDL